MDKQQGASKLSLSEVLEDYRKYIAQLQEEIIKAQKDVHTEKQYSLKLQIELCLEQEKTKGLSEKVAELEKEISDGKG